MRPIRTRFAKDIVAEFLPPVHPSRHAVIVCQGMPSVPSKRDVLEFFSKKGYWTFHPRYRGTWESGGVFLRKSPHEDIIDILNALPNGFRDTITGKKYSLKPTKVVLVGTSFGGPAVLLASSHPAVKKVVALAPVVDWKVQQKTEPLNWLLRMTRESFGEGYRGTKRDAVKLYNGRFYNPMAHLSSIEGKKIMIMHQKGDSVVPYEPGKHFAELVGCKFILLRGKEHSMMTADFFSKHYRKIRTFFSS